MRKLQWVGAAVVMGLLFMVGGCGKQGAAAQAGGETPKAVLLNAGKALEANDVTALAACFAPSDASHHIDNKKVAELMLTMKRTGSVMEAAQKKFGDQAGMSMGPAGFILAMMSQVPDLKTMGESGEIKIEGDEATVKMTQTGSNKTSMSQTMKLEKVGDRWYMSTKELEEGGKPEQMEQFATSLKGLLDSMESATASSKDAKEYGEKIKPAVAAFTKALQESMKPGE